MNDGDDATSDDCPVCGKKDCRSTNLAHRGPGMRLRPGHPFLGKKTITVTEVRNGPCPCNGNEPAVNQLTFGDGRVTHECNECLVVDLRDFRKMGYSIQDQRGVSK